MVFLWFAGHQTTSYRDVADRFDISISSLFDILTRVISFLSALSNDIIKFPSPQDRELTKQYYNLKRGFPNIIGKYRI